MAAARVRPAWDAIARAAESVAGRKWEAMAVAYGDWGRDGAMTVATRHLGWRLVEVVREVGDVKYAAAAPAVRRFWRRTEERPELARFARRLRTRLSIVNV